MKIRSLLPLAMCAVCGCAGMVTSLATPDVFEPRVYQVNKKVSEFPEKEDLSTPESAYAAVNRICASGEDAGWRRVNYARERDSMPADAPKRDVKPEIARADLEARILEVRIFQGSVASVLAEVTTKDRSFIDKRSFKLRDGRWLNVGQDCVRTMALARAKAVDAFAISLPKPVRPKIGDPVAYLKPFVEHLAKKGESPGAFVMKALATHKLTIMGEVHHRPRYWAFNAALVTDPDFPKHVGTIYMELPSNDQALVDKFLAGQECDTELIIAMLRDNLWMGWPDQAMLDYFVTVWRVNQDLPPEKRLRIVIVDMKRPWKDIKKENDWREYEVDRNKYMAEGILADMRQHPEDRRNALFIVGFAHAGLDLKWAPGGTPFETAGWHLKEAMGSRVYAIFPHTCLTTNNGQVDGRVCWGLFDSAFAAMGNKPMAFPLDTGPFGEQRYDAELDYRPMYCRYRDGFQGYLYLGPLEYELFSPLIAGFYTDDFVKELDRRMRLEGKGLVELGVVPKLDAESFTAWMGRSWGKPRMDWGRDELGPLEAWQRGGSDWKESYHQEKLAYAREHPEVAADAAKNLLEFLRTADYKRNCGADDFLPRGCCYMVINDFPDWVMWMQKTFGANPIVNVEVGKAFVNQDKLPAFPYKVTLKDGTVLEGTLPFDYDPQGKHWYGIGGLDWHAKYPNGLPPKSP